MVAAGSPAKAKARVAVHLRILYILQGKSVALQRLVLRYFPVARVLVVYYKYKGNNVLRYIPVEIYKHMNT